MKNQKYALATLSVQTLEILTDLLVDAKRRLGEEGTEEAQRAFRLADLADRLGRAVAREECFHCGLPYGQCRKTEDCLREPPAYIDGWFEPVPAGT